MPMIQIGAQTFANSDEINFTTEAPEDTIELKMKNGEVQRVERGYRTYVRTELAITPDPTRYIAP